MNFDSSLNLSWPQVKTTPPFSQALLGLKVRVEGPGNLAAGMWPRKQVLALLISIGES